ncbi:MAG: malonyl-ACP O-methyltransferase BioC [Bacteroidota bacterium]|nr:malonyl-ACP O-methyltransferase BioC [Bacteroidota bacterium]
MKFVADKKNVQNRFRRSFETYNLQATVQKQIASKLADLIPGTDKMHFNRILEIGCGTGFLTQRILSKYSVGEYLLNDMIDAAFDEVRQLTYNLNFNNFRFIASDAETMTFPENMDAVLSASSFQWFNDIETFIPKIYSLLKSGGIFAFSTFGENNFSEIKTTLNVGLNYKTLHELLGMVQSNFELIVAEEWTQQMRFDTPNAVLKHMKMTGVNGLKPCFLGKEKLRLFNENYCRLFGNEDKTVRLTYHPIIIIARKN